MLSLLRKNVFSRRGNSFFFNYPSVVRFISTDFTPQTSISVSAIDFFKNNGFSDSQISKITRSDPEMLRCSVDKILKPKFDFFKSQGISGSDLAQVICQNPCVLRASLHKKIIPCFEYIKTIVHTDAKLLALFRRSMLVLMQDPHKKLIPNMALLQQQGVPAHNIARLLIAQPRSFVLTTSRFRETVEEVRKMEFDPKQYLFLEAVVGLTCMSRSSLEAKFDVYRKWGLSEDEMQAMFRRNPRCMMISEENIVTTMNYFVNEMGYSPSLIAKQPNVIMFSLKKRIIPRCSVIQILKGKGLVGDECNLVALLALPEDVFLKKYVIKFEKEVPEVVTAYQGKGK